MIRHTAVAACRQLGHVVVREQRGGKGKSFFASAAFCPARETRVDESRSEAKGEVDPFVPFKTCQGVRVVN